MRPKQWSPVFLWSNSTPRRLVVLSSASVIVSTFFFSFSSEFAVTVPAQVKLVPLNCKFEDVVTWLEAFLNRTWFAEPIALMSVALIVTVALDPLDSETTLATAVPSKFKIVPSVTTFASSFWIAIPEISPVNWDPSPTKFEAVTIPLKLPCLIAKISPLVSTDAPFISLAVIIPASESFWKGKLIFLTLK